MSPIATELYENVVPLPVIAIGCYPPYLCQITKSKIVLKYPKSPAGTFDSSISTVDSSRKLSIVSPCVVPV
jgi:hypothetical protein